jgi:phosphatidylglycerol---prolipoprotein diacylglyceryl transferase
VHRIIFTLGPITVYSYGFFVALGVGLSIILAVNRAGKEGIKTADMLDILSVMVLGGLIGGRLLFVAINWEVYLTRPAAIFYLNEGGMAFQGALVISIAFGALMMARRRIPFWKTIDVFAPYLALAHSIGRIGCFFNGCCYGKQAFHGFAVVFPGEMAPRIPTQLYSSLGLLAIFVLLVHLRVRKPFDGYLFAMYLMLYSVFRIFMDTFRGDELVRAGYFTLSQVIGAGFFLAGALIYFALRKKGPK